MFANTGIVAQVGVAQLSSTQTKLAIEAARKDLLSNSHDRSISLTSNSGSVKYEFEGDPQISQSFVISVKGLEKVATSKVKCGDTVLDTKIDFVFSSSTGEITKIRRILDGECQQGIPSKTVKIGDILKDKDSRDYNNFIAKASGLIRQLKDYLDKSKVQ